MDHLDFNAGFGIKVDKILHELSELLKRKNKAYGNSALEPLRVFSQSSDIEQINVRIDDKLSRIKNQSTDEDAEWDLMGYLVLKRIVLQAGDTEVTYFEGKKYDSEYTHIINRIRCGKCAHPRSICNCLKGSTDATRTTPTESIKEDAKETEQTQDSVTIGRAEEWKDTKLPKCCEALQECINRNSEKCLARHSKTSKCDSCEGYCDELPPSEEITVTEVRPNSDRRGSPLDRGISETFTVRIIA